MAARKPKSTNPFDSDSSSSDNHAEEAVAVGSNSNAGGSSSNRRAQLDFNFNYEIGDPALQFNQVQKDDTNPFVSPLEQAFKEVGRTKAADYGTNNNNNNEAAELDSSIESEADDFINEESPLVSTKLIPDEIYSFNPQDTQNDFDGQRWSRTNNLTVNTRMSSVGKNSRRKESTTSSRQAATAAKLRLSNTPAAPPKNRVLTELNSTQPDPENSIDYKMIRLEDLGTASSWLILLLPYFAFVVCLWLESDNGSLKVWGPAGGAAFCFGEGLSDATVPILPTPPDPCIYQFHKLSSWQGSSLLEIEQDMSIYGMRNSTEKKSKSISRGTAFESGIISGVPPSTSVFYGDASFRITTETVAFVARGSVSVSALLFQREDDPASSGADEEQWSLVATSRPERLSMACHLEKTSTATPSWACNTPRIMEILFSMPGSAILLGRDLRVNILFSKQSAPENYESEYQRSYVYTSDKLYKILASVDPTNADPDDVLVDIVQASEYTITHTDPVATIIDIVGRMVALLATFAFTIFWLSRMGVYRFSLFDCFREHDELYEIRRVMSMLESPWILFPERWYILFLLLSLILIQGPLLVAMYFSQKLNGNPVMHTATDTLVGVGVNGVLFVYLCLLEGLRHHTAEVARKFVEKQRNISEIRRAAKYVVAESQGAGVSNEDAILRYTADYFERHGDIDGISSIVNLRLQHDPLSHNSADFLIPKILIFVVGTVSIWLTAFTRFHFSDSSVSAAKLRSANAIYLVSYVVQFSVLILWLLLIVRSSVVTGTRLRTEPFLSTRSAQLAFRVILAHVTLGLSTLAVLFFLGFGHLIHKWESSSLLDNDQVSSAETEQGPASSIDFWMQILTRVTQRFPYSGTAASVGLGRIFFATVSIFIAAFIFLPPWYESSANEESHAHQNLAREEKARERRDKRAVVSLLKNTHSWRVLPLPVERASVVKQMMLSESFFQVYQNGRKDYSNFQDRGLVSVGPYTAVYCTELACWLHEASFQAYYSPRQVEWNDWTPGKMNLNSIGLRLEAAVLDEATNTQAYIASNIRDQVDGEEDKIIVIAFRGSVDASNLKADLKWRMVPLLDQMIGIDIAPFRVSKDDFVVDESDGWTWNAPVEYSESHTISCFSPKSSLFEKGCMSFPASLSKKSAPISAVTSGAMAVLSAAPVTRDTIPCCHEGFQEVYSVLRKKIIESLLPVVQRQMSKAFERKRESETEEMLEPLVLPKIYITGHSLGGSLAQLLALDLASNCELVIDLDPSMVNSNPEEELFQLPTPASASSAKKSFPATTSNQSPRTISNHDKLVLAPPIAVYTYGSPRVGNRAFAHLYKQKVPHTFRVATEGDPITALPTLVCSGIYKHAGLEVILDEGKTGNTLVGPTVVETLFRFHKVRTDFAAHSTDRYRDCLESALEQHELQEYYKGHSGTTEDLEGGFGAVRVSTTNTDLPDWMMQQRRSGQNR